MSRNPNQSLVSILSRMSLDDRIAYFTELHKQSTGDFKVYLPYLDCFMTEPLTYGNSKLDKSIAIFDMLAIVTCLNCETCKDTCYALKAQRQYVNVLLKRSLNTYLAMHHLDVLHDKIAHQLYKGNKDVVRIHSSGDFISQDYINMWTSLAKCFPHIRFYSYTKVENIFNFTAFESLHNVNIVRSILPNGKPNYGTFHDMLAIAKELHCPICAYRKGMPEDAMPHCGKNCTACLDHKYVLFVQH